MAEKQLTVKENLEYAGLFDFKTLYSFSHSWFKDAKYGVNEEKYSEKIIGDKKNIVIEWLATKDVSDYFKFEHKIRFSLKDLVDVEVEIDGTKKKMNQGRISIDISGNIIKDKDSKWETSPFNKFMRDIYNKYVIPSRINELTGELTDDVRNFKEELKAFLELTGRR